MSLHPSTPLGWAWLCQGVSELLLGTKVHQWVLPGLPGKWGKALCPHNMQDPATVPSGHCHALILPEVVSEGASPTAMPAKTPLTGGAEQRKIPARRSQGRKVIFLPSWPSQGCSSSWAPLARVFPPPQALGLGFFFSFYPLAAALPAQT